jgi:hypothetical protein
VAELVVLPEARAPIGFFAATAISFSRSTAYHLVEGLLQYSRAVIAKQVIPISQSVATHGFPMIATSAEPEDTVSGRKTRQQVMPDGSQRQ